MMFSTFQEKLFEDGSTSSAAGSPASRSASPARGRGPATSDISGLRCLRWYVNASRAGSSLKMFAACLVHRMGKYTPILSHRWKGRVTPSQPFVFRLQPSAHRIVVTGCGLWGEDAEHLPASLPTPQARDFKSPDRPGQPNFERKLAAGRTIDLNSVVALLPTPTCADASGGANQVRVENGSFYRDAGESGYGANLQSVVASLLPTPKRQNANPPAIHGEGGPDLQTMLSSIQTVGGENTGLTLQPDFALWMMGFPEGWCDLDDDGDERP